MTPQELNALSSDEKNDALWFALQEKNWLDAEDLWRAGADVEATNVRGETPLRFFAADGKREAAAWLLDRSANIDAQDRTGDTALMKVVESRDFDRFQWIMELGPDLEIRNEFGVSPLMQACAQTKGRMLAFVEQLVAEGADVDAQSQRGGSPLLNAIGQSETSIVKVLLEAGANVHIVDSGGLGVLHHAVKSDDPKSKKKGEIGLLLLAASPTLDVNLADKGGTTPLYMACATGKLELVEALNARGVNWNVKGRAFDGGLMPLMTLLHNKKAAPLIPLAVQAGADVNARDEGGNNVLWHASMNFNIETLGTLVQGGADVQATTGVGGRTPMHALLNMAKGKPEQEEERLGFLQALISMGFPVDPPFAPGGSFEGSDVAAFPSPLSNAIVARNLPAVNMLLDAGAQQDRIDQSGFIPLHYLVNVKNSVIEKIALEKIAKTPGVTQALLDEQVRVLKEIVEKDRQELMDILVEEGGSVNQPARDGVTPLMHYVQHKQDDLVVHAVNRHGGDLLQQDEYGDTAVSWALKSGNSRLFQELVFEVDRQGRGAELKNLVMDVVASSPEGFNVRGPFVRTLEQCAGRADWINVSDEKGNTPLIVAAATNQSDVVDGLIKMGADVNHANSAGETALMHAVLIGNSDIIVSLLKAEANRDVRDVKGRNAHEIAVDLRKVYILKTLTEPLPEIDNFSALPHEELPLPGSMFRSSSPSVARSRAPGMR